LNEIKATSKVEHQHIIRVILTYEVRAEPGERQEFGIVMTPVAEENLKEFLARYDDPRITLPGVSKERLQRWFWCLSSGLAYIHSKPVRHGDVKPSNILIKNGSVFYADFAISKIFQEDERTTTDNPRSKRSPMYCSPEVEYELSKNSKSDIFSLGCVFMEIITILCRRRLQDFAEYRGDDGDQAYHSHLDKCMTWMKDLRDAIQNDSNKRQEIEAWKRVFDLCNMMT
jgi:serine/threonine protein kinase